MFKIQKKSVSSDIRLGILQTAHGDIQTPFFMPDATRGYVKGISASDLEMIGVAPMVVNTFHLYLQPGMKIINSRKHGQLGGIHKFMNWPHPLLSDSGGFQVFSLIHKNPKMGSIQDNGAVFKSPIDGSMHKLTPEKSIQIQFNLGVDMMVCLDDCPPNDYDEKKLGMAVKRTIAWAKKCRKEYDKEVKKRKLKEGNKPLLFSVIQGGKSKELRKYCAQELIKIGFDGYGFGARPVDENGDFLEEVLRYTADQIPKDALRFALGIGTPEDILKCASYGWDMFDCVIPTREARHGRLFFWKNKFQTLNFDSQKKDIFYRAININNAKFAKDFTPINQNSRVAELRENSKAYLSHLFKMREPLGQRLATMNNLEFYMDLMEKIKNSKLSN